MELKGQVTISIADFEKLKEIAEQKERLERQMKELRNKASRFYEIDAKEFWEIMDEIDSHTCYSERQIRKKISEARKTLKIIVDTEELKRTIRLLLDKNNCQTDSVQLDIKNASDDELEEMEVCFREEN